MTTTLVKGSPEWKRRRIGKRLGRYRLGPALGAGGAATVYLARLTGPHDFERFFAIKVVHEHLVEDRELATMFLDEAKLAVLLSHPNIVDTYELGHHDNELFIVMEYLAGKPLSQVLARAFKRKKPLDYDLVAWIGARAADALNYAHGLKNAEGELLNIVHRDISPDNLFITYDGQVKVIDFGIAHAEGRLTTTSVGQVKGKFRYMSPEYALGRSFDHTLDFFALAASLYEVALGTAAFQGSDSLSIVERLLRGDFADPKQVRADFPDDLAVVLTRAMSPDADRRFASGREICDEFERIAGLTPTAAQEKLAAHMTTLFAEERKLDAANLAELREVQVSAVPDEATPLHHALASRPKSSGLRTITIFGAVGVAAALAALTFALREPAPVTPAPTTSAPDRPLERNAANAAAPIPSEAQVPLPIPSSQQARAEATAAAPRPSAAGSKPIQAPSSATPRAAKPPTAPEPSSSSAKPPEADPPAAPERSGVIRDNPFAGAGPPGE